MAFSAEVDANPLLPGETVFGSDPGNTLSTYTGTVIATVSDFQQTAFSSTDGLTVGFLSSAVVQTRSVTGAPVSGLDFVYQINVSAGTVNGFTISSFQGSTTDVFQTKDIAHLSGTNPFTTIGSVQVSTYSRSTQGDSINVTFGGNGVTDGNSSYLVVIHTNSTTFKNVKAFPYYYSPYFLPALSAVQSFAPVPEPSTFVLLAGTFGLLTCFIVLQWRKVQTLSTVSMS